MISGKTELTFKELVLITVALMLGSGFFFVLPITSLFAGPAAIIAWVIIALYSLYITTCYGELITLFPYADGIYDLMKHSYGRFVGFITGWILWLIGNIVTVMLLSAIVNYLLPYLTPTALVIKVGISLFWIAVLNYIAFRGLFINVLFMTIFGALGILLFAVAMLRGLLVIKVTNFMPFFISMIPMEIVSSLGVAGFFAVGAFFGLAIISFLSSQTLCPDKLMPKSLMYGMFISILLSLLLVVVSFGIINRGTLIGSETPLELLGGALFGGIGAFAVTLGIYLVVLGAVGAWIIVTPRFIAKLSADKMFFPEFGRMHRKYKSPHGAIMLQVIVISALTMVSVGQDYLVLLNIVIPLMFIINTLVLVSVPMLRLKKPYLNREFKVSSPFLLSSVFVLMNVGCLTAYVITVPQASVILQIVLSLLLLGVPIYIFFDISQSPSLANKMRYISSYLDWMFEGLFSRVEKKMFLESLGDLKNKTVLEYGCRVGHLTQNLVELVKPFGIVYAISPNLKEVQITQRRLRRGYNHYEVLHEPYMHVRLSQNIPSVDVVASIGELSYVTDLKKVLYHLNKRLSEGGRILVMEYVFRFSNPSWLSNDEDIYDLFETMGFKVNIVRKKGFFVEYVFMHAIKARGVGF